MNSQFEEAVEILRQICDFNGHTDLYNWYADPETSKLFEKIREFLKEVRHEV
jgi:hypothetical protein